MLVSIMQPIKSGNFDEALDVLEKIELRNVEMSLDIQTRFLQVRANIYYLIGSVDAMYSELKKIAKILPKIENIEVRETLQTFKDNISLALAETESLHPQDNS